MIQQGFQILIGLVFALVTQWASAESLMISTLEYDSIPLVFAENESGEKVSSTSQGHLEYLDLSRLSIVVELTSGTQEVYTGSGASCATRNRQVLLLHHSNCRAAVYDQEASIASDYLRQLLFPFHSYW